MDAVEITLAVFVAAFVVWDAYCCWGVVEELDD